MKKVFYFLAFLCFISVNGRAQHLTAACQAVSVNISGHLKPSGSYQECTTRKRKVIVEGYNGSYWEIIEKESYADSRYAEPAFNESAPDEVYRTLTNGGRTAQTVSILPLKIKDTIFKNRVKKGVVNIHIPSLSGDFDVAVFDLSVRCIRTCRTKFENGHAVIALDQTSKRKNVIVKIKEPAIRLF